MAPQKSKIKTDKERILEDGVYVECYICRDIFYRKRETRLFCNNCERGFCIGEHGTFVRGQFGSCIYCHSSLKQS